MSDSQETRPRRAYQSARRQQQAVTTRAEVVDAALLLFAERGWAGTGMRDVAREAGVSVETVYANFRSKSDLLMAAINVGVNPTFGAGALSIEAHLLDYTGKDLYGARLMLGLCRRLRGEERFPSVDALVAQIRKDIDAVRSEERP